MGNTERQIILGEETPTSGIVLPASGVTYFKLKDKIYEGDDTKNCGLVGAEMDNNFFVLRGLDIKSMDLSGGTLTLTKFNGGAFSAQVENTLFEFNKEEGKLIITYPNGEETTLEGFVGETDSKYNDLVLATDGTIKGNGIPSKPLRLSELEKTGTYAPVDAVVDELPETGAYKGQRLIVQETLSNYGLLYPYEGIELINDALEKISSEWRVPSREDWDSLLNYFECEEKKNHGEEGEWLGEKAGVALKSELLWKESSGETMGMDVAGFRALPMGYKCMGDDGAEIEGVGRKAAFWALDTDASNNSCVKIFEYDKATVGNFYLNKANKCSLRLCKDYNKDNFSEIEDIFELPYSCVLIDNKIWTSVNVYFSNAEYSGITSDEWKKLADYIEVSPQPNYSAEAPEKCDDVSMYYKKAEDGSFVKCAEGEKADGKTTYYTPYIQEQEEKYFVGEWDGNVWLKKPMNIGDSVAIESYDGETYHEWRLFSDGLKDVAVTSMDTVTKELIKETDSRIAADKELDAKIQKHSEILGSKGVVLTKNMNNTEIANAVKTYWEDSNKTLLLYGMNNGNQKRYIPLTVYGTPSNWRLIGFFVASSIPAEVEKFNAEQIWKISYDYNSTEWKYTCNSDIKFVKQSLNKDEQKQACENINALMNKDGVIETRHLSGQSVTSVKIKDNTIGASKLGDNAVVERVIKSGSVTTDKIASGAVTSDKIADGAIEPSKINSNAESAFAFKDVYITGNSLKLGSIEKNIEIKSDFNEASGTTLIIHTTNDGPVWIEGLKKKVVHNEDDAEEITNKGYVDGSISFAIGKESSARTDADSALTNAIGKLNGGYDDDGSVKNTANSILQSAIITDGTVEETGTSHSLARKIKGKSNPSQYYISPYASDMYIKIKSTDSAGTTTETERGLQEYILSLEERIAELEKLLASTDFISGTDKEIKVIGPSEGKWTIGFADNAVFYDNDTI